MNEGKLNSRLGRRVLIVLAIAGLLAILLALYYFVYAPNQKNYYNKSAFRILKSISENFKQRINGYDTTSRVKIIPKKNKDNPVDANLSQARFEKLAGSFKQRMNAESSRSSTDDSSPKATDAEIMAPIVAIRNNIFETVILSKKTTTGSGLIEYKSGSLDIDEIITIDTLLKKTSGFTFPTITDVSVEGINYKLFIYPFRNTGEFYLLGGFIGNHEYQVNSNRFPLTYILTIAVLIIIVLLSIPILKIFLIGSYENISINDVRALIAMIFITPFLFILFNWTFWIGKAESKKSEKALATLHQEVIKNFTREIGECLLQLRSYDSLYNDPVGYVGPVKRRVYAIPKEKQIEFRDLLFYPSYYKNLDVVFWMNNRGQEVTKWYFQNKNTRYLNKSERQYFKDIDRNEAFHIPGADTASFSIQPTLSLVTGDYTVNIAKHSEAKIRKGDTDTSAYIGLSSKMYSVFQPVVPKGLNFCIINAAGEILYHSESNRNLQENIFSELSNYRLLKLAISNRDSIMIDNVSMYDKDIKLVVSPMQGLPYYLVTYCDKRNQYLFTRHIIAFSFLCESAVLLILSLFVLFFYFANKRYSELFFSPQSLDWIKPSSEKKNYYILIIAYQLIVVLIMLIFYCFTSDSQTLKYVLNASLLLPFFVVIGYYLIRSAESNAILYREQEKKTPAIKQDEKEEPILTHALPGEEIKETKALAASSQEEKEDQGIPQNMQRRELAARFYIPGKNYFLAAVKIIVPYLLIIFLLAVLKEDLKEKGMIEEDIVLERMLILLEIIIPLVGIAFSLYWYHKLLSGGDSENSQGPSQKNAYMKYLLAGLIISITLISIVPTFCFIIYANKQELSLQVKTGQMHLAKRLQQHRKNINEKVDNYKFSYGARPLKNEDEAYINNLKFNPNFGLYLEGNALSHTSKPLLDSDSCVDFLNFNFYKGVTAYLFMPADHSEYFKNTDDFYWKLCQNKNSTNKSLLLYYSNASDIRDYRDTSSFILSATLNDSLPFISELNNYDKSLQVLSLLALIAALCVLIFYASKRVFLIGYFEKSPGKEQDFNFPNKIFGAASIKEPDRAFWNPTGTTEKLDLALILAKENTYPIATSQYDECILKIQHLLARQYEKIWNSCSMAEKSVLYDFALDGFTNYKNVNILYPLYKKGILRKENHHLVMMTGSFRNYLIAKSGSLEISNLQKAVSEGGKWGRLSSILYILFFAIIIFLFIVQEEVSKRILAIVTSIGAIIPILLKLFNNPSTKNQSD